MNESKNCNLCTHNKSCPKYKKLIRKQKKGFSVEFNACKDFRTFADIFDAINSHFMIVDERRKSSEATACRNRIQRVESVKFARLPCVEGVSEDVLLIQGVFCKCNYYI